MKKGITLIALFLVSIVFFSCQKQLSFEPVSISSGTLTKDSSGACSPIAFNGTYKVGQPLNDTNYIDVSVNVTATGTYSISTDTLNGIYFNDDATFATTGVRTVRLKGHGTPAVLGSVSFTVRYNNSSSCTVTIVVSPSSTSNNAVFTLDGSPGACTTPTILGTYTAATLLDSSNKIIVSVNVTTAGNYVLSTTTANGFTFNASGSFTGTGPQTVILYGSGTPAAAGPTTMSVSGALAGCDFSITVNPQTSPPTPRLFYNVEFFNGGILAYEIYSSNLDGTNEQQLTNFSNNGTLQKWAISPSFNEDSTKIIFVLASDIYGGSLMSMNLNGTGVAPMAASFGNKIHDPFVFQNGQKLLFWKDTTAGPNVGQVFSSNIDGTNLVKLTSVAAGSGFPDGSCIQSSINKNNTTIVYYQEGGGIFAMNTDGSNKHLLVASPPTKDHPRFSPNGSKIVFSGQVNSSFTNSHREIFIMNADGTNILQLTNYSANGTTGIQTNFPVFSPDGNSIYYTSEESGKQQIYKMNTDGTNKVQLTSGTLNRYRALVK